MTEHADVLADFDEATFTHDGKTRTVYRMGTGPAVIVIHEMPGLTPLVADFGRRVGVARPVGESACGGDGAIAPCCTELVFHE